MALRRETGAHPCSTTYHEIYVIFVHDSTVTCATITVAWRKRVSRKKHSAAKLVRCRSGSYEKVLDIYFSSVGLKGAGVCGTFLSSKYGTKSAKTLASHSAGGAVVAPDHPLKDTYTNSSFVGGVCPSHKHDAPKCACLSTGIGRCWDAGEPQQ